MISSAFEQAVAAARLAVPLERGWRMMNSIPEGASGAFGIEAPAGYLELLRLTDGPSFGEIVVYGAKTVEKNQHFADYDEGATVRLGRNLWFCFGKVAEDPLFINRQDGSVWGFPDQGIGWQDSDVFENLADSLGEFLEK